VYVLSLPGKFNFLWVGGGVKICFYVLNVFYGKMYFSLLRRAYFNKAFIQTVDLHGKPTYTVNYFQWIWTTPLNNYILFLITSKLLIRKIQFFCKRFSSSQYMNLTENHSNINKIQTFQSKCLCQITKTKAPFYVWIRTFCTKTSQFSNTKNIDLTFYKRHYSNPHNTIAILSSPNYYLFLPFQLTPEDA